jgi:formylmethanofuran dehydrogenase subunit B
MHPFPAEHDQQQAEALEILREAKAFLLVHFTDSEDECENPLCGLMHSHRSTSVIASCSSQDLHHAMTAIGEEILITNSINTLMSLNPAQREMIAAMLRDDDGSFLRLRDDEK